MHEQLALPRESDRIERYSRIQNLNIKVESSSTLSDLLKPKMLKMPDPMDSMMW